FQRSHSETGPRIELKLVSPEVAENTHRQFGARDQNIESTVPALAVQRAELPGNSARLVTSIADADEDLVPLIPLDVLQVLDEERLAPLRSEKRLGLRHLPAQQLDLNLDQVSLRHTKCSNPQR